jgi:hypothetical protein
MTAATCCDSSKASVMLTSVRLHSYGNSSCALMRHAHVHTQARPVCYRACSTGKRLVRLLETASLCSLLDRAPRTVLRNVLKPELAFVLLGLGCAAAAGQHT